MHLSHVQEQLPFVELSATHLTRNPLGAMDASLVDSQVEEVFSADVALLRGPLLVVDLQVVVHDLLLLEALAAELAHVHLHSRVLHVDMLLQGHSTGKHSWTVGARRLSQLALLVLHGMLVEVVGFGEAPSALLAPEQSLVRWHVVALQVLLQVQLALELLLARGALEHLLVLVCSYAVRKVYLRLQQKMYPE